MEVLQQFHIMPVNQTLIRRQQCSLVWLVSMGSRCYVRLVNDRPLLSSQAVWAEYELMHCNMTVIIPLGEPAVLQGPFSFSFESKVSKLPLALLLIICSPLSPFMTLYLSAVLVFSVFPFHLIHRQTYLWGSLSLSTT